MKAITEFKILRLTKGNIMVVVEGGGNLYIHMSWIRKEEDPFFHQECEDNPSNRYFNSSANPHDSLEDKPAPTTVFTGLNEIEDWLKTQKQ